MRARSFEPADPCRELSRARASRRQAASLSRLTIHDSRFTNPVPCRMPTTARPVFRPEISFKVEALEERATIIHCSMTYFGAARIWPSTYLVQDDGTRKGLLQAFGIAAYPNWKWMLPGETFTLVFEG